MMCYEVGQDISSFCFGQESHCGREEALKKACSVCDDAVRSSVPEVVCAVFVFEQGVSWMQCVSDDSLCSFLTALCIDCIHGGEFRSDNPLCSLYDSLQSLPLCLCGVSIPHRDACGEDALYQSFVDLGERATVQTSFSEQPDEVQSLLCFFHCGNSVQSPVQI